MADGMYVTTFGIGVSRRARRRSAPASIRQGDRVLLSRPDRRSRHHDSARARGTRSRSRSSSRTRARSGRSSRRCSKRVRRACAGCAIRRAAASRPRSTSSCAATQLRIALPEERVPLRTRCAARANSSASIRCTSPTKANSSRSLPSAMPSARSPRCAPCPAANGAALIGEVRAEPARRSSASTATAGRARSTCSSAIRCRAYAAARGRAPHSRGASRPRPRAATPIARAFFGRQARAHRACGAARWRSACGAAAASTPSGGGPTRPTRSTSRSSSSIRSSSGSARCRRSDFSLPPRGALGGARRPRATLSSASGRRRATRALRRRSRARAPRGALTVALPGDRGGLRVAAPSDDAHIHQEIFEILGHTLYESVHVFFEHRADGHDVGASGFLYPFLGETQQTPRESLDATSRTRSWPRRATATACANSVAADAGRSDRRGGRGRSRTRCARGGRILRSATAVRRPTRPTSHWTAWRRRRPAARFRRSRSPANRPR